MEGRRPRTSALSWGERALTGEGGCPGREHAGQQFSAQGWYRDPAARQAGSNLTTSLSLELQP